MEFQLLLDNFTSTTLLPNMKKIPGHCHGKMQTVLKSQVFQHWLSNVPHESLHKRVCSLCFDKIKILPLLMLPCTPTPSRSHHVWPMDADWFSQFLPRLFSTHIYVNLIQIDYTCFHQQVKHVPRILNPPANGFLRIPFETSDFSD